MDLEKLRRAVSDAAPDRWVDLVGKGLRNPRHVPPFVLGTVFPDSAWGPNWRESNGVITFEDGGFAGGDPSRPELSARIYREARQLDDLVGDRQYSRSLEIGCGYGRLAGWIAAYAGDSVGIDPDGAALRTARTHYPDVGFVESVAQNLPFEDDSFDLLVSWGVLQHVPPADIDRVTREIRRVSTADATVVLCEMTSGEPGRASWPRSRTVYERLLAPLEFVDRTDRPAERTFTYARHADTMVFRGDDPDGRSGARVPTGPPPGTERNRVPPGRHGTARTHPSPGPQ